MLLIGQKDEPVRSPQWVLSCDAVDYDQAVRQNNRILPRVYVNLKRVKSTQFCSNMRNRIKKDSKVSLC